MVQFETIFVGSLFLVISLITLIKPEWYIKFAQWQAKLIWKAEFNPSRYTKKRMRILGIVLLAIALFVFYNHLILGNT